MKKKIHLVSSILMLVNLVLAQEPAEKKFRFGLKISPTPTWYRSNETKLVEKSGTKFGFGFGLQMEFRITSTAHFVTGIGGDFLGGKQSFVNEQGYVLDNNNNFVDSKNISYGQGVNGIYNATINNYKFYEIKSRSIKATYITIPLMLKLMTKDISGFKYFGKFGGNIAVQTKFRTSDELTELKYNALSNQFETSGSVSVTDMKPTGDLVPINIGLNAGIGAEYNLSGSTSVFLSINYLRGFINQYQKTSDIMVDKIKEAINTGVVPTKSKQSAFCDGIQINIGILF